MGPVVGAGVVARWPERRAAGVDGPGIVQVGLAPRGGVEGRVDLAGTVVGVQVGARMPWVDARPEVEPQGVVTLERRLASWGPR